MKITVDDLRKILGPHVAEGNELCRSYVEEQLAAFHNIWPEGLELTFDNFEKAMNLFGLDYVPHFERFVHVELDKDDKENYEREKASAWREFREYNLRANELLESTIESIRMRSITQPDKFDRLDPLYIFACRQYIEEVEWAVKFYQRQDRRALFAAIAKILTRGRI